VTSGDGVTVSAPGATVVLRGLSINGQGGDRGIYMDQAARLRIESCIVSNMSSAGILHGAANGEMMVLDTIVRDNAGHGIAVFSADASIVVDHVRSEHNSSDGILFPAPGSTKAAAAIVFGYDNGGAMYARGAALLSLPTRTPPRWSLDLTSSASRTR